MDEARLSAHERRVLAEIEEQLDQDASLARRLRTMRRTPRLPAPSFTGARRHLPALGVVALGVMTLTLFVLAVDTEVPALIWAFASVWVLTLVTALLLGLRWAKRRAAEARTGE